MNKYYKLIILSSLLSMPAHAVMPAMNWQGKLNVIKQTIQDHLETQKRILTQYESMTNDKILSALKMEQGQADSLNATIVQIETDLDIAKNDDIKEKAPNVESACGLANTVFNIENNACFKKELQSKIVGKSAEEMSAGGLLLTNNWYENWGQNSDKIKQIVWGDNVPQGKSEEELRDMAYEAINNGNLAEDPRKKTEKEIIEKVYSKVEEKLSGANTNDNASDDQDNIDYKALSEEVRNEINSYTSIPAQNLMETSDSITNEEASNIIRYKDLILPNYETRFSGDKFVQTEKVNDMKGMAYKIAYDTVISKHISELVGEENASDRMQMKNGISQLTGFDLEPSDPNYKKIISGPESKNDALKEQVMLARMSLLVQYNNYINSLREENIQALKLAAKLNNFKYK